MQGASREGAVEEEVVNAAGEEGRHQGAEAVGREAAVAGVTVPKGPSNRNITAPGQWLASKAVTAKSPAGSGARVGGAPTSNSTNAARSSWGKMRRAMRAVKRDA